MFASKPYQPFLAIGMVNLHLLAIAAVVFCRPTPADLAIALGGYLWFGFASSLYYHRYLTHRGFELTKPVQWFFLAGGLVGLSGDPVRWVCTHRYHHQHSDGHDDLHSPLSGWWYAHFGWLTKLDMAWVETIRPLAADVRRVPWLRCWENPIVATLPHFAYAWFLFAWGAHNPPPVVATLGDVLRADVWAGLSTVLWGLYVPLVASFHFGWMMIASFCHLPQFGYRRGNTPDQSRNIWWLGFLSFGESFHNNHHVYPRRAKHGVVWWEPDPTKALLWLMERVGLAWNVVWDFPTHRVVPANELDATAEMVVAAATPAEMVADAATPAEMVVAAATPAEMVTDAATPAEPAAK